MMLEDFVRKPSTRVLGAVTLLAAIALTTCLQKGEKQDDSSFRGTGTSEKDPVGTELAVESLPKAPEVIVSLDKNIPKEQPRYPGLSEILVYYKGEMQNPAYLKYSEDQAHQDLIKILSHTNYLSELSTWTDSERAAASDQADEHTKYRNQDGRLLLASELIGVLLKVYASEAIPRELASADDSSNDQAIKSQLYGLVSDVGNQLGATIVAELEQLKPSFGAAIATLNGLNLPREPEYLLTDTNALSEDQWNQLVSSFRDLKIAKRISSDVSGSSSEEKEQVEATKVFETAFNDTGALEILRIMQNRLGVLEAVTSHPDFPSDVLNTGLDTDNPPKIHGKFHYSVIEANGIATLIKSIDLSFSQ